MNRDHKNLAEEVRRVREAKGLSRSKFGEKVGLSQATISRIEHCTQTNLRLETLNKLESEGVSIQISGKEAALSEFAFIPKYKARLSGGGGSWETDGKIEANLAFRKDWLNSHGLDRNNLALFEVIGDSMAPHIYSGAVIMVDRGKTSLEDIVDGKIYAFRQDDRIKVKRLFVEGTTINYRSDNKIEGDEGSFDVKKDSVQILGRVIWVGHELR